MSKYEVETFYTCTFKIVHKLEELSEKSRQIIRMRYFDGLAGIRVAEKLGRKPETVYKSLQRIYVTLAQCIERKIVAHDMGGSIS